MKFYALIFAGGSGMRMTNADRPKQFLEVHGKPVIIWTIENFSNHPGINGIVVVCIADWIPVFRDMLKKYNIEKVIIVVPGEKTGQLSIFNGLTALENTGAELDSFVMIHDGVRPLIDAKTISDNITAATELGSAITTCPMVESVITLHGNTVTNVMNRDTCFMARAPQTFKLCELLKAHRQALTDGRTDFIDSATMMFHYGHKIHTVAGPVDNIKITTPHDVNLFRAIAKVREFEQTGEP